MASQECFAMRFCYLSNKDLERHFQQTSEWIDMTNGFHTSEHQSHDMKYKSIHPSMMQ